MAKKKVAKKKTAKRSSRSAKTETSKATDKFQEVREKTVGDVIDCTLEAVRKRPGAGVIVAALLGFFLGRLLKW